MGSFNWFNRQYEDKKPASENEAPEVAESKPQAEPSVTEPPAVNEDYLSFAKAAYANIRKRQQEEAAQAPETKAPEAPEAEAPETETLETETLETAAVEQAETVGEATEEEQIAPLAIVAEAQVTEAPVAEAPVTETAAEPTTEPVTTTTGPEQSALPLETELPAEAATETPTITSTAPLPFWAQAEAERQERLERLKAEAQQEAEAEMQAARAAQAAKISTEEAIAAIPDFVLDEAFLWSAEVLASQGRRPDQISLEEITWLKRLRQGLDKTRRSLVNQLRAIVGQGPLNQDAVMEIESLLLQADVGIEATDYIIESLQNKLRQETLPPQEAIAYLKQLLREMLDKPLGDSHSLSFVPEKDKLNIWLVTGVNGAGKTTTIGKIAHIAQKSGYRCLIAAADTFRAAAVQQVKVWGERSNVEVIANPGKNTDPAAVVFDAIAAAQARDTELLIVDTAGRLQNKKNLMEELSKIRRIIDKKAPDAVVESLLVLDSTLGQNGLRQAEVFSEVAKLSGVVLTKLDGTAKGGIALAVVQQLGLPIRFIGAGEGIEDLRPFSSYEFIEALLSG